MALVRAGQAEVLMKGSLHTDEFMQAVVTSASGLRTGRRLSHVYIIDVPAYPRPLLVTDAAVNIAPNLEQKRDIVQNAADAVRGGMDRADPAQQRRITRGMGRGRTAAPRVVAGGRDAQHARHGGDREAGSTKPMTDLGAELTGGGRERTDSFRWLFR
jgi:hypothetical protein